ncbi:recombinase family protein [Hafnia alvei]|nr:recombinase family protein [Hafnia alvei ATCC 13337]TBL89274.1 recombinase family protein [Hafnia alvei]TBM32929.1 recombinase family protein [Hafnia alvei]
MVAAGYALEDDFVFVDENVSGTAPAEQRPALMGAIRTARRNDISVVVAIDCLGRHTIDVLSTVETIKAKCAANYAFARLAMISSATLRGASA